MVTRRHALCCGTGLAAGLFTGLLDAQPRPPAVDDLVHAAFEGLDRRRVVDTHTHLLGNGDGGSGCWLHPSLQQWWHPLEVLRRRVILGASGVADDAPSVDRAAQRDEHRPRRLPHARLLLPAGGAATAAGGEGKGRARRRARRLRSPAGLACRAGRGHDGHRRARRVAGPGGRHRPPLAPARAGLRPVGPLVSLPRLVAAGLLAEGDAAPLAAPRAHNPLLFDFVLKRRLRCGQARLPAEVFEARALPATVRTT